MSFDKEIISKIIPGEIFSWLRPCQGPNSTSFVWISVESFYLYISFKGEVEFYESPPIYGSCRCCSTTPCNTLYGRKCGRHHISSLQSWFQDRVVPSVQLCACIFCELGQLFSYEAHQRSHCPGIISFQVLNVKSESTWWLMLTKWSYIWEKV